MMPTPKMIVHATATKSATPVASARRSTLRRRRSDRLRTRRAFTLSSPDESISVMSRMIAIASLSRFVIGCFCGGGCGTRRQPGGTRWLANTSRYISMSSRWPALTWMKQQRVRSAVRGSPRCSGGWVYASCSAATAAAFNSSVSGARPAPAWSNPSGAATRASSDAMGDR